MILRIQKYCVAVRYKPGKELLVADTLSRACQQSHTNIAADDLSSIMNVDIIGILPIVMYRKYGIYLNSFTM